MNVVLVSYGGHSTVGGSSVRWLLWRWLGQIVLWEVQCDEFGKFALGF